MPERIDPQPQQPTPTTVAHARGLTFKVVPGDSPFARVARNVRRLVMADGSVWTVGLPIGWRGQEAAWQPTETDAEIHARRAVYGESSRRLDRLTLGLHITDPRPRGDRRSERPAPNPEAATLYTRAADDYENAARDAERLGAHDRAASHRQKAAQHRALAHSHTTRTAVTR